VVRYGMTPMQAIVAGTSSGATLLGLERDIGTIAVGKRADLVAVTGDPLQNIQVLERVDFRDEGRQGVQAGRAGSGPERSRSAVKRFPAFDPPEYVDWKPDPALVRVFRATIESNPERAAVIQRLSRDAKT